MGVASPVNFVVGSRASYRQISYVLLSFSGHQQISQLPRPFCHILSPHKSFHCGSPACAVVITTSLCMQDNCNLINI